MFRVWLLYLILFITVIIWIVEIMHGDLPYVDQWTRGFVSNFLHTPLYLFFRRITELGSRTFVIPFVIVMASFLLFRKRVLPALFFSFGTLGSHLLNKFIKGLVERERPSTSVLLHAEGYSFPSGHAMISIVCYSLLAYFLSELFESKKVKRVIKAFFVIVIVLIGFSRYVLNVHYLTDIVAGFLFGYVYVICLLFLYEKLKRE